MSMSRVVDEIELINGILYLHYHNKAIYTKSSYMCPFNDRERCGENCIHFCGVEFEPPNEILKCRPVYPYTLRLSCGCGLVIESKKYSNNMGV